MPKRNTFSREFKLEAIRLMDAGDKKAADLARELGVPRNKLYLWREELKAKDRETAFPGSGRRRGQDAELAALQRENERLREEQCHYKKSRAVLRQGIVMRYHFIREHDREFRITALCRVLGVSRSGYYGWRTRPASARTEANARLLQHIRKIHAHSRENYGAVKTWEALTEAGVPCGLNRVARLRQAHGIEAKRMRRFQCVYAARHHDATAPNLLNRDFTAPAPDRVWVGDVTFVATREGWLYLAVLLDLYSRKVVGGAMGRQQNRQLVIDALTMAIEHRRPRPGLIHHTDQGILYATSAYRAILTQHGMIPSMSRKGDCYDNAVAESFFSNLKNELTWHHDFRTRDEARAAVFDYIEVFYNRQRLHQTLDYVSPVRYEERRVVP